MTDRTPYIDRVWHEGRADADVRAVSGFFGRIAGSPAADATRDYLLAELRAIGLGTVRTIPFPYEGFMPRSGALATTVGGLRRELACTALPNSPSLARTSLEVVDLGRGTPEDFAAAGERVRGRAVLVTHEFPFSTGHVHRWVKYREAKERGAALFLIANNNRGVGPVVGSSGRNQPDDIPALGLSYEAGRELARQSAFETVVVDAEVLTERRAWTGENVVLEIPGQTEEWVVLSAHYDGHAVSENALDNGSGLAVALDTARLLAADVGGWRRGLRVMFFTFEEWGLSGSKAYVESLTPQERTAISVDLNLDTVVGHPQLNALTGANASVEALVRRVSNATGVPIIPVRPVRSNSDHYNFQEAGIPALRLIAGYEEPETSLTRFLLTPSDTLDMIDPVQLKTAAIVTAALVHEAATGPRVER